jgi:hypothetical protein
MPHAIAVLASFFTCIPLALHHFCSRLMFMHTLDHVQAEPKLEVQEEHVQKEHGGPQATSCVDTNIAVEQSKP